MSSLAAAPVPQQLDLTEVVLGAATIDRRFRQFHERHPEVYAELVSLARQAKRAGRERIGIKMLFEVVRWNRFIRGDDNEEFRLNNNYHSRYARLIHEQEPDLAGIFELRELRTQ